jgi:hypothetical protein
MTLFGLAISASLLAGLAAAAPAGGQARPDANCRDDNGTDRCAEDQQRRMRELYGAMTIEQHQAAGDEVRRIFYVDGYGRDLVLVSFLRAPGRDPELLVQLPPRGEEARPEPMRAAVPQSVWNEVIAGSRNFHRSFAPEPGSPPGEASICMHSWVYTIESAERPLASRPATVRRKIEDACEDGPGQLYALDLQRTALSLLPHCAALAPDQHRNPASTLAACRVLHGDRLAAAEALNLAETFQRIEGPQDAARIAGLFAHQIRIDWAGQPYRGSGVQAAPFWAEQARPARGSTNLSFERVEGESADRVRMTGLLSRTTDTPRGAATGNESARVELIWVRDQNGTFAVSEATVGRWTSSGGG